MIRELAYVRLPARELGDWNGFGSRLLGLHLAYEDSQQLIFRMDERAERITVDTKANGQNVLGWEAASATDLERIANNLDATSVPVRAVTAAERGAHQVRDGLVFSDPDGNRNEVCIGFHDAASEFTPGRSISGFRTGELGLGHVVLQSSNARALLDFYRNNLGFKLSDYVTAPFEAFFLHTNARHHSLAIIQAPERRIHHVMLEFNALDDVGQGYDLAQERDDCVGVTLGRHSNDHMTSFYAKSPSGQMVECGWGGLSIDPNTWTPVELLDGPSLWGHDRSWLPDIDRHLIRKRQIAAAARGVRHPVHVSGHNYDVSAMP